MCDMKQMLEKIHICRESCWTQAGPDWVAQGRRFGKCLLVMMPLKRCGVRSRLGRHESSAQRGLGDKHAGQLEGFLCKPGPRQGRSHAWEGTRRAGTSESQEAGVHVGISRGEHLQYWLGGGGVERRQVWCKAVEAGDHSWHKATAGGMHVTAECWSRLCLHNLPGEQDSRLRVQR